MDDVYDNASALPIYKTTVNAAKLLIAENQESKGVKTLKFGKRTNRNSFAVENFDESEDDKIEKTIPKLDLR